MAYVAVVQFVMTILLVQTKFRYVDESQHQLEATFGLMFTRGNTEAQKHHPWL